MSNLAAAYLHAGWFDKALPLYEEALKRMTAKLGPEHPWTLTSLDNLATVLAVCPDPKFRDAHRAIELAKRATVLKPQDGAYWHTLGVAQYRAGDWRAAIAAFEKSMELLKRGNSFDFFYLA